MNEILLLLLLVLVLTSLLAWGLITQAILAARRGEPDPERPGSGFWVASLVATGFLALLIRRSWEGHESTYPHWQRLTELDGAGAGDLVVLAVSLIAATFVYGSVPEFGAALARQRGFVVFAAVLTVAVVLLVLPPDGWSLFPLWVISVAVFGAFAAFGDSGRVLPPDGP